MIDLLWQNQRTRANWTIPTRSAQLTKPLVSYSLGGELNHNLYTYLSRMTDDLPAIRAVPIELSCWGVVLGGSRIFVFSVPGIYRLPFGLWGKARLLVDLVLVLVTPRWSQVFDLFHVLCV